MQGLTYFQSRSGVRRKPATLLASLDLKHSVAAGTQQETLQALQPKFLHEVQGLQSSAAGSFYDWRYKLKLGFSLLFYGYGSKKLVLDRFGVEACTDGGVLAINAWAHSLNIRSLLLKIIGTLRSSGLQSSRASGDARSLLKAIKEGNSKQTLYIIIHGIDSPGLRSAEAQSILSELAALPYLHLVASMDHVNAHLLWDKRTAARFNWLYQDLTTFSPYHREAARIQPLLCSGRGENERQGAAVVLQTLVPQAREIFRILAQDQLETDGEGGMTLHQLFKACRERFLVTNELALRSHLNEFRDHQLVQNRRGADGIDLLHIPMSEETIQQILTDVE